MDAHSATSGRLTEARRLPRWLPTALAVALGYYFAARLGFAFTLQTQPISTLWPPNALLAAALMLAPRRDWWWMIAAALPAHLAAELQSGVPLLMVLGWFASNCSEALLAAGLVRLWMPGPVRLDSLRSVTAFVLGAGLAAPFLSSLLDVGLVRLVGWGASSSYWELVRLRSCANVMAEVTVGPLILAWAAVGVSGLRAAPRRRNVEAALLVAGLVTTCLLVFDVPRSEPFSPAALYAPLPFLLWAAMRFGMAGTSSALALMGLAVIWGTVHGIGPFTDGAPQEMACEMQLFVTAVTVPLLLLGAALEERARVERETLEQRRQLAHLSRVALLGDLSGGIAHELNQPLTAILSNAQAAQQFIRNKTADPELLAEILHDIVLADQRAADVIERLRALFKRGETHLETLDANRLVREVLSLAQGDLATRGVEVELKLAAHLPEIRGDRVQLEQVLLNLIVNAADAMALCRPKDRLLTVSTLATSGRVHLSVVDRGPGFKVPADTLFQAFYPTKPKGLGLGLSISKSIIIAHGGRLGAVSRRGGGAAFLITLPSLAASR